ncbi:hypothetical protein AOXY_G25660 [Acipenser oxyrinchus oxyrinchus]|uniref:Uncharacterized protein n=1 Tax=Acipenser oxyrinchus oxyrinchus TaxID=40147 RepID=A0AAD8FYM1_ACIOX|nr:hypothetical protein AOXY_G25660 [Acipenser oxyrinchus oxyrinchus]
MAHSTNVQGKFYVHDEAPKNHQKAYRLISKSLLQEKNVPQQSPPASPDQSLPASPSVSPDESLPASPSVSPDQSLPASPLKLPSSQLPSEKEAEGAADEEEKHHQGAEEAQDVDIRGDTVEQSQAEEGSPEQQVDKGCSKQDDVRYWS